jgi:hypothetical protein
LLKGPRVFVERRIGKAGAVKLLLLPGLIGADIVF